MAGEQGDALTEIGSGDVITSGSRFRVEVTPGKAGPISIIYAAADGKRTVLHKASNVRAGKRILLPAADDWYELDDNAGVERIIVEQQGETGEYVLMHTSPTAFKVASIADLGPLREPEPLTRGVGARTDQSSSSFRQESEQPSSDYLDALERLKPDTATRTRSFGSEDLYARHSPGVVFVVAGKSIGSGSIISEQGHIVTNWHVVGDKSRVGIIFKAKGVNIKSATVYPADVLRFDELADLALVKVRRPPRNLTVLKMGTLDNVRIGMRVHAIGHPSGESWTYTQGVVSQVHQSYKWVTKSRVKHAATVIQTQTPISPGSSGGPLLADNGRIVGVNTFYSNRNRMGYSVAPTDVQRFLNAKESRRSEKLVAKTNRKGCHPKLMGVTDNTPVGIRPGYRAYHYDTNCNGRVDAIRVARSRGARPTVMQIDRDEDGVADLRVYYRYKNRYNLWVFFKNGRAVMVGYDYNFDGKVDRYQRKRLS